MASLSILIPSLFPPLVARMIQSIHQSGLEDYEIVVCSPARTEGDHVVWVRDAWEIGCDPAIRAALFAATGKTIMVLADDHVVIPGTLPDALREWESKGLMDLNAGWKPRIFGVDSVCFSLCERNLALWLQDFFFPYIQHFGDHSFALAARRSGVEIRQSSIQCLEYPWENRLGCKESPTKTEPFAYRFGKGRLFGDFPEFSKGWENREDFNT